MKPTGSRRSTPERREQSRYPWNSGCSAPNNEHRMRRVSVSNLAPLPFGLLFAWTALMGLNPPRIIQDTNRVGIKDMAGRVAPLTPPAQRVVSIAPILADYLTIDQGSSHIVGMARPSM